MIPMSLSVVGSLDSYTCDCSRSVFYSAGEETHLCCVRLKDYTASRAQGENCYGASRELTGKPNDSFFFF